MKMNLSNHVELSYKMPFSLFFLFLTAVKALTHVTACQPLTKIDCFLRMLCLYLMVNFWQVEHILDAIFAIIWMHGSFAEEFHLALRPHLVETILVLVYTVTCIISLQNLVQTQCFDIAALLKQILCLWQFLLLGNTFHFLVGLKLHQNCFSGAGIKHISDAGLEEEMQSQWVMPAIMENLENILIDHHVSQ